MEFEPDAQVLTPKHHRISLCHFLGKSKLSFAAYFQYNGECHSMPTVGLGC